jgi:hypothetical protein
VAGVSAFRQVLAERFLLSRRADGTPRTTRPLSSSPPSPPSSRRCPPFPRRLRGGAASCPPTSSRRKPDPDMPDLPAVEEALHGPGALRVGRPHRGGRGLMRRQGNDARAAGVPFRRPFSREVLTHRGHEGWMILRIRTATTTPDFRRLAAICAQLVLALDSRHRPLGPPPLPPERTVSHRDAVKRSSIPSAP